MKLSYKRRLLNRLLIASTVLLAASLAQTTVAANSSESLEQPVVTTELTQPAVTTEQAPATTPSTEAGSADTTTTEATPPSTENTGTSSVATTTETPPVETSSEGTATTKAGTATPEATTTVEETTSTTTETSSPTAEVRAALATQPITLETTTVYLSEPATLSETASVGSKTVENVIWTLDGKPISEWKTWDLQQGDFVGEPFITVEASQAGSDYHMTIQLAALFGSDLSKRTPSNIRRTYRHYMKDFLLEGVSADGSFVIQKTLHFRPYASFRTHEEMLAEIEESKNMAASDRQVTIDVIGTSAQNRDIKMGIVAKDQASIDKYLTETTPLMLTKPDEMLIKLKEGSFDYKLPVLINNTHADEQPGIDIITSLFRDFATKDTIDFSTTDADGKPVTHSLKVADLLNKFIFLFNFTENPDGDVLNLRSLVNGLDPNRDAGFQVNPETRAIITQIHKWNPISVLDVHGFVSGFLIEPATPPHDPNFEYDLMADLMLEKAHEMGRTGVANSKYTRYTIPKIHWGDGWDDSFSGYTAVYAMYHGILGHTIEIPETNEESFKAGFYAVLGGIRNMSSKPDALMEMRLKYYSRGVNKVEDPKAEAELVGPGGEVVGRIKKDQPKFFPDYYVIPMTLDKNNDLGEAFKMIDYFKRNGVIVKELTQDMGEFKKGDLVVDMAQAKRGFANHVLYSGSNESKWGAMYAELVVNFPDMKGFKIKPIFSDKAFDGKLADVSWTQAPRTREVDHQAPYYVVANTSESAVQAINQAIKAGAKVYLTEDGFIMKTDQFAHLLKDFALYGEPLYKQPVGKELKPMKVYAPSHYYRWAGDFAILANSALALERMGFEIVATADEADAIVLESDQFDETILGKKPVIVVGGAAMQRLEALGVLKGFNAEQFENGGDFEGLMKAIVDDKDPLTSGYAMNSLFYSNSGNWIEGIPEGFRTLVRIAGQDYYIAGWWPGYDQLANKVVAIAGHYMDQPLFIYAGNPTNKVHPVHFFRWVSNSLFGTQLASLEELPPVEVLVPQPDPGRTADPGISQLSHTGQGKQVASSKKTLPNTGAQDGKVSMVIGSLLLLAGGFLFNLKRKED